MPRRSNKTRSSCPICSGTVVSNSKFLPFCSKRCQLLDLGNWLNGRYVLSRPLMPDEVDSLREEKHLFHKTGQTGDRFND
ncbi:MAG: DNA gyrase inhibitor YacG [Candidatus Dadabacteria bacterium]|nr:MAG: DNA gyrase inhibitor YacG [Candidatus Dadabacteria bacterium]